MFNRFKKRSFGCPPPPQAVENKAITFGAHWNSKFFAELGKTRGSSAHCQNMVSPCISLLMLPVLPLAVSWRIALGVVHSFKCQTKRTLAHVSKEIWKAFPPPADGNPPASVVMKVWVHWILTPRNHAEPSRILLGLFGTSLSMTKSLIAFMASAGDNFSVSQMRIANRFYCSAIAAANASVFRACLALDRFGFFDDDKSSKSFTVHGYGWWHLFNCKLFGISIQPNSNLWH